MKLEDNLGKRVRIVSYPQVPRYDDVPNIVGAFGEIVEIIPMDEMYNYWVKLDKKSGPGRRDLIAVWHKEVQILK